MKRFDPVDPKDCWIWEGKRTKIGYPSATSVKGFKGNPYRLIYMMMVGPVRPRWHLHHTCENGTGGCVNPYHLTPIPPSSHTLLGESPHARHARKTHCKNGHEFTPENTLTHTKGYGRRCKTCKDEAEKRFKARHSKDELNRRRREHYARNVERERATKQAWRDANREKKRASDKAYRDRQAEAS